MALTLTVGRNAFKICHKSGSRTTVWDVTSDDDEGTLLQTFKDVVSFVEGDQAPEPLDRLKRLAQEEAAAGVQKGFPKPFEPPAIPDHLKGEVELEEPAAPGNGWAAQGAGE
jgi:hypothetical protein